MRTKHFRPSLNVLSRIRFRQEVPPRQAAGEGGPPRPRSFSRPKVLLLILLIGLLAFASPRAQADAVLGETAPAFVMSTRDGKTFDLSALKGKVVVVYFWATWCVACQDEMPALEALWRRYHGEGLDVIAVNVDQPRTRKDVDPVMKFFSFPSAYLSAASKNELVTVNAVPLTYLIDREGKVTKILAGQTEPLTEEFFGADVKALLTAKKEAKPEEKPKAKTEEKTEDKAEDKPGPKGDAKE